MACSEKYEDFKPDFLEYREFKPFKALSNEDGLKRFPALCPLVDRAEKQLSIFLARDVIDFAAEMQVMLLNNYEAVYQGDHKSAYISTGAMDGSPGELAYLKAVYKQTKFKPGGFWNDLALWGCRFAIFALMKVAEAVEATDDQMAANAAIDAMDSIGLAEIIEFKLGADRDSELYDVMRKEMRKEERDAIRLREVEVVSRRQGLSTAGRIGAKFLHQSTDELKAWALSQAKNNRSSDMDIARHLAKKIPKHLENASKNPERLIYDALRAPKESI